LKKKSAEELFAKSGAYCKYYGEGDAEGYAHWCHAINMCPLYFQGCTFVGSTRASLSLHLTECPFNEVMCNICGEDIKRNPEIPHTCCDYVKVMIEDNNTVTLKEGPNIQNKVICTPIDIKEQIKRNVVRIKEISAAKELLVQEKYENEAQLEKLASSKLRESIQKTRLALQLLKEEAAELDPVDEDQPRNFRLTRKSNLQDMVSKKYKFLF